MKLFYIQSPYYWRELYTVAENLGIEAYEILVAEPMWTTEAYDNVSAARKICLFSEQLFRSSTLAKGFMHYDLWGLCPSVSYICTRYQYKY